MILKVGGQAPEFSLPDQSGAEVSLSSILADLGDDGRLVLYFYPADFTPVCTAEACAFRDRAEDLSEVDARIVGISPQSVASHARFAEQYKLPFPLLFDEGKKVIKAYGVDGPMGFGVRRATYLIGADGVVQKRVVADVFLGSHLDLIREVVGR